LDQVQPGGHMERVGEQGTPAVTAVGVFDGVHIGHRCVVSEAVRISTVDALSSVVVTFHPHPAKVLAGNGPPMLMPLEERIERLESIGVNRVVVLPFGLELSRSSPRRFVEDILVERLASRVVVVGFNFTFGRDGTGSAQTLRDLSAELGFRVVVHPPVTLDGMIVSSSEIRRRLALGEVTAATRLLGRPYRLKGTVVRGSGRGRDLGFPTANLCVSRAILVPAGGVYAALVDAGGGADRAGVVHVGPRPTFDETAAAGDAATRVEVHILDYEASLYGQEVSVSLVARLRGAQSFDSLQALSDQISSDVERARALLATRMQPGGAAAGDGEE